MAFSLCGVRGLDIPCSAHIGTGSQTYENQRSKRVTAASSTSPYERFDRLYPIPDLRKQTLENKLLDAICKGISGTEIIEISDKIADVICDQSVKECADVGRESEIDSAEPEALCCSGDALIIIFFTHEWLRRAGTCDPNSDSPRRHCNADNTLMSQDIFCLRSNG
jgi:hypothetical protein